MSRPKRIVVSDFPYHVVQRGLNRMEVFKSPTDYDLFLGILQQVKSEMSGIKVYAFCLMNNHLHLVLHPHRHGKDLSAFMRKLTTKFSSAYNFRHGRVGTLWSGRFKSSLIETDAYLLCCCRYVELNPVRAGLVKDPAQYIWSSYHHRIGTRTMDWLDDHPLTLNFGKTVADRHQGYRKWICGVVPDAEVKFIDTAIHYEWITGRPQFKMKIREIPGAIQRARF